MNNIRIIARLDVKAPNVVKGVQMEGLRKLGDPNQLAKKYYQQGADEILYVDTVASLYGRNSLLDVIRHTVETVFIPITVGGGIRSVDDARKVLRAGADKIAINTAAIENPSLIDALSKSFGAQCVVLSVQAKTNAQGHWEAYYDNGREHSGLDVLDWVREATDRGAGEILLTSVDRDGTRKGYDLELCQRVADQVNVPVIASGGMWDPKDFTALIHQTGVTAAAIASCLHYDHTTITDLKAFASKENISVRENWQMNETLYCAEEIHNAHV